MNQWHLNHITPIFISSHEHQSIVALVALPTISTEAASQPPSEFFSTILPQFQREQGPVGLLPPYTMADLQVFATKFSPYGHWVQIALTEKNIHFELIKVELDNKPEALLKANPIHKKIPTIIHNGKPVAESLVILEYLEDAFPEHAPLMPKDAYERSRVRFWINYVYQTFTLMIDTLSAKPGSPEQQAAKELFLASLKTLESGMNSFSPEGPFFTGDKFGSVDVVLAPLCITRTLLKDVADVVFPGPDELPRFHKWIEATKAHRSVSAVLPLEEEIFKAGIAKFEAMAAASAA